ncbi:unnamed protein product, partial [Symbiodinium sp. KB8]
MVTEEKERVALEARRFLRSVGNKRYGTFLKELKARGLSVTTSEAAELYHRVEPRSVYGSAHSQVASAFGGVDPPTLPAGPSEAASGRTGRGDRGQPAVRPSASSREPSRTSARRPAAPSPVAEDPEEGATLAELKTSFLSPFDPEAESLEEYEERLQQGVEMARFDCRDEAISLAESCLGEAQFQTAYTRFSNLCRTTPAAARPDGPDHVLRAIGAGISKLLQMPGADPVAVYYRYKGAADAYAEAGGFRRRDPGEEAPPAPDYFAEAGGVGPIREEPKSRSRSRDPASWEERYQQYRATMPDEQASAAPSLRAHLPEKALPQHYDLASSPSGQDAALLAIVQEMRRQREQDAKERAEQLKSMREEKSVFTYSLRDDLPVFGDGDSDLDKHLEAFSDVCMVVKPKGDREKLRLFARTLKGTRRRCYDTIIKEAKHNGDYESKPASVFDRVVALLDASFHESDEAKAMKARARYDSLEKRATQFQEFQVSWLEALTELNSAGVYKCQKDLLYDYLHKIGSFLRDEVSRDRRFWPLRPSPGVKQEFRGVENWSEAALVAREITLRKDANKALESHHASSEAEPTRSPKNTKNKKNESGNGGADATRAQTVGLPSGTGDRCKHCNNPGHITSLCPRKAAEKRGESEALLAAFGRTGAVCNLCAAVGIKDGSHRPSLLRKTSMVPVALHREAAKDAANTQQDASQTLTAKEKKAAKKKEKDKVPKDLKTVAAAPSPGYPAQTRTSCAGVELVTLIDSGATCGSLPEWLFAEIYERTAADVAKGKFTWSLHKNPSGLNVCLAVVQNLPRVVVIHLISKQLLRTSTLSRLEGKLERTAGPRIVALGRSPSEANALSSLWYESTSSAENGGGASPSFDGGVE